MPTRKNAGASGTEGPDYPEPSSSPTIDGAHDLSDHPGVASGTLRNVGDTVRDRDPSAPTFRRPKMVSPDAEK